MAESWTKSADGLTWTFNIRKGVKWMTWDGKEYGEDVKAHDSVTTAKWILDAKDAARSADLMFVFVGAEDYYDETTRDGVTPDWSKVGIKATDDYKLEFTLTKPLPYFLSMLTYNWGYPTNAKYLAEKGDNFGMDPKSFLYCGAFLCSQYEPESLRTDTRNSKYWDAAVMYAGDIIEYGTSEEIFHDARHPYTWALLAFLPQLGVKGQPLYSIKGTPPSLFAEIKGNAFAPRNPWALEIDFVKRPPYFAISDTHKARTWLLDPRASKVELPLIIKGLKSKTSG